MFKIFIFYFSPWSFYAIWLILSVKFPYYRFWVIGANKFFCVTLFCFKILMVGLNVVRNINRNPFNDNDCWLQRGRRLWRHLSDERRREEQWDLLIRTARHIQKHLQDRHYVVPLWWSALRDEIRLLDVRRFSGRGYRTIGNGSAGILFFLILRLRFYSQGT